MSDYYSTLGVSKNASDDEIKKAYRKLAMQHHPDRGGDQNKFKEIQEAYDTLSDQQRRAEYDNPSPFGNQHFGGVPPEFESFFNGFGFGGNPFGFNFRQQQPKNKNLNVQTTITLEDAYNGKDLIANITLPNGREQTVEIKIPKGIQNGTTLRLAGMGDNSYSNLPRGDLHLTVNILPHSFFQRQGDDLIMNIEVDAIKSILGTTQTIKTIGGKTFELRIHPGTQHGRTFTAPGYGMPRMNDSRFFGNLFINVNIKVPTDLTNKQIEILKTLYENN